MNPLAEAYLDEIMDWNANGIGESTAKEVMFDVLSALAACHSVGVAHCNVRPEV
jgi:serine/threonine protein kinase